MNAGTVVFLVNSSQVLLGMKKVRFGQGRWNGFGGGIKPGESIGSAAARASSGKKLELPWTIANWNPQANSRSFLRENLNGAFMSSGRGAGKEPRQKPRRCALNGLVWMKYPTMRCGLLTATGCPKFSPENPSLEKSITTPTEISF